MKLFYYLISALLILALAGLFVFKKPDGSPWLNIKNIGFSAQDNIHTVTNTMKNKVQSIFKTKEAASSQSEVIYKWQDEKGEWHYSQTPSIQYKSVVVDVLASNVLSLKVKEPSTVKLINNKKEVSNSNSTDYIPMNNISTVLKDAKNIQNLMDERTKKLDKAIENH